MLNHFNNNSCITAKSRLCETLKNLVWFNNVDMDTFFPKCYHLNSQADYFEFIEEFKINKAESILKRFVNKI
jgi:tubulin monoglycylase TTLL3/8